MKVFRQISTAVLMAGLVGVVPLLAQEPAQQSSIVRQTLQKIVTQEHDLVKTFGNYSPRVETYMQEIHTDKDRSTRIVGDDYFLGRLEVKDGVIERSFLPSEGLTFKGVMSKVLLYGPIMRIFSFQFQPGSFAYPIFLDPRILTWRTTILNLWDVNSWGRSAAWCSTSGPGSTPERDCSRAASGWKTRAIISSG